MRVSDVLNSKGSGEVFTLPPTATVAELLDRMADLNIGAVVVSEDGEQLIGIVSERDVVRKLRKVDNAMDKTIDTIMTTDVRVCAPEDSFGSLMAIMTDHRIRHVPVLEDGRIVGVLSIGDAVKYRMDQLEFERDQLNNYVAGG